MELVEPIIEVQDGSGQSTETRIGQKVAEALREESAEDYRLAFKRLEAIGRNPPLDWETVTNLQDYLSEATEAIGVLRALTPLPEEKREADA